MKKLISTVLIFALISVFIPSIGICSFPDDILVALSNHNRKEARELLSRAALNPKTKNEATMMLILLNDVEYQTSKNMELFQGIYDQLDPPSPYIFSFWIDDAIKGKFTDKNPKIEDFLKKISRDENLNSSLRASMHYVLGEKYFLENKVDDGYREWSQIGALGNWQLTGHFDNTSGSGFDKNYDPVYHPEPDAKFVSRTNSTIWWFSPKRPQRDGWIAPCYYIPAEQGVIYAQTFVDFPATRVVDVTLGGAGSLKLWVNDQEVICQESELRTDLDLYKRPVLFKKGCNRILVQVGFTDKTNFPNFLVRLLDKSGNPVEGITSSQVYKPYPKGSPDDLQNAIPHFAEEFFREKLQKNPDDLLSALLLDEVYYRSSKFNQAIEALSYVQKKYPGNILIETALLRNYNKLNDRTQVLKQVEKIRDTDPDLTIIACYDFEGHMDKENYAEASKDLEKIRIAYGDDHETYLEYKIRLQNGKKDYQEMINTIEYAFSKYPENSKFLQFKFQILKNVSKNPEEPSHLYEKYLSTNLDSHIWSMLVDEYSNLNNTRKVEQAYQMLHKYFPEDVSYPNKLAVFYYNQKNYKATLQILDEGLENAPFYSMNWSNRGYVNEALGNKTDAIEDMKKAIHYNPNLFDMREKLRQLQNKQPIETYFGNPDDDQIIQAALDKEVNADRNFEILFNEHNYVLYPEGAAIEYMRLAVKVINDAGVNKWKESEINYNNLWQKLTVEKAEVRKKSGSKVEAEQNDNQLVFTSLEPGDVIYIIYRFDNYTGGKLAKELWFDHVFNDFVPVGEDKLRLFVPNGTDFITRYDNITITPKKSTIDDFTCYEWTSVKPAECKSESYMPPINECGMAVHVSTIKEWRTIAEWYRDTALPQAKEDYNVNETYRRIFGDSVYATDRDKAKAIYNFICTNIRSSFVSFRQSNFTPQTPMVTLSTQLGDCKDLSTLFFTLARKAGLKTHLVLVNTRDNGENAMQVPAVEFNHCIVLIDFPDGQVFQELTNPLLGFGIVPSDIVNAQALVIPNSADDTSGSSLIRISGKSAAVNAIMRKTTITTRDKDLLITTENTNHGTSAADYRGYFYGLSKDELRESLKNYLSKQTGSNMILDTFSIQNLQKRDLPVTLSVSFRLDGEIKSIGGMKVVKIPFFEKIMTLDPFPDEKRVFPVLYWSYENVEDYETEITLDAPPGTKFVEIPEGVALKTGFIDYSLKVDKLSDNKLKIVRSVKINRITLPAARYDEFREAAKKVVKAEDLYVAYK